MVRYQGAVHWGILLAGLTILIFGAISFFAVVPLPGSKAPLNQAGISYAIGFMSFGLGLIAVTEAFLAEDFLRGVRRVEGNEKIAMLYTYADGMRAGLSPLFFGRMRADVSSIPQVESTMTRAERGDCAIATRALIDALVHNNYPDQAHWVETKLASVLRAQHAYPPPANPAPGAPAAPAAPVPANPPPNPPRVGDSLAPTNARQAEAALKAVEFFGVIAALLGVIVAASIQSIAPLVGTPVIGLFVLILANFIFFSAISYINLLGRRRQPRIRQFLAFFAGLLGWTSGLGIVYGLEFVTSVPGFLGFGFLVTFAVGWYSFDHGLVERWRVGIHQIPAADPAPVQPAANP